MLINTLPYQSVRTRPLISVLIVLYHSNDVIEHALHCLASQTFRDFEVVIVANSPHALHPALSQRFVHPCIVLEPHANIGFAAGNNVAAGKANGTWLALLNPDAFPRPDWLEQLIAATTRRPDVRCFASLQLLADAPWVLDGAGDVMTVAGIPYRGGYHRRMTAPIPEGEVFSACGAAMLVDRDLFLTLGGFDERFFCYCEDVDFGYRLRIAGFSTLLIPTAQVEHVGFASSGPVSDFSVFHGARNRIWTFVKNTPSSMLWWAAPLHVAVTLLLLLLHLRRGDASPAWRGIQAAFARADFQSILACRKTIQTARRSSLFALLRVMSLNPIAFFGRQIVIRCDSR